LSDISATARPGIVLVDDGDGHALGLPREFLRKWEFYFRYCEAGFAERALGDIQVLLVKPGARP